VAGIPETPIHIIAVIFTVLVGALVVGYKASGYMADSALDKRLAEQATKVAVVSNSLSGPGSGATVDVQVPEGTIMRLLPGKVEFEGRNAQGSIKARTDCNLVLPWGSYSIKLTYETSGISCELV
jgi:hypothetical protein